VEVFSVQNFTGYIYMGGDPFETEQVYYVAKVFDAVARAVRALGRQYFFMNPEMAPPEGKRNSGRMHEFRLPSHLSPEFTLSCQWIILQIQGTIHVRKKTA
jgi:hypothetical protein